MSSTNSGAASSSTPFVQKLGQAKDQTGMMRDLLVETVAGIISADDIDPRCDKHGALLKTKVESRWMALRSDRLCSGRSPGEVTLNTMIGAFRFMHAETLLAVWRHLPDVYAFQSKCQQYASPQSSHYDMPIYVRERVRLDQQDPCWWRSCDGTAARFLECDPVTSGESSFVFVLSM